MLLVYRLHPLPDIIFIRIRHFPILNLFGEKGTGKITLATYLQSFFLHGVDPPNLGVTSVPAMNDRVSQAVNTLAMLDEYKMTSTSARLPI